MNGEVLACNLSNEERKKRKKAREMLCMRDEESERRVNTHTGAVEEE